MSIAIGLLPCQQESFERHEELSKLLNETDVFYVPFQNDFNNNHDLSDLTKRFDEDISKKHLVVTFRDIGFSLFLDSVQSIPDQNDHSKTRISGKMIVDGICVQFLGCFDCINRIQDHSDIQQIHGVGRVKLDEDYYRELSSKQISFEDDFKEEKIIGWKDKMERSIPLTKTRSRTISENMLGKSHNHSIISPPSSVSNSRSRLHSPSHMPYPLRSPRTHNHVTKTQYQASSPINIDSSSISRSSGFHSSFISPSSSVPSSYNENPLELSQQHHIQLLSQSPQFSSSLNNPPTMPMQIPSSNTGLPPTSLPPLTGLFPITQSHSLPTYFLPQGNLAYLTTGSSTTNTNMFLFTNSNQPVHIITPLDRHSLQYSNTHHLLSSHPGNIIQSSSLNESISFLQHKRNDSEENKQIQPMDIAKQFEEQLPFKKRRYTGKQSSVHSPMDTNHHDDDEGSNESMKK